MEPQHHNSVANSQSLKHHGGVQLWPLQLLDDLADGLLCRHVTFGTPAFMWLRNKANAEAAKMNVDKVNT